MLVLAIDTAGQTITVTLAETTSLIGETTVRGGRGGCALLSRIVDDLTSVSSVPLSKLDLLAVTVGPGAFTGLRVGIGFVKGLASALNIPVVPLSSLEVVAASVPFAGVPVLALIDARKGELYAGSFSPLPHLAPLREETVIPPERIVDAVSPPFAAVGNGALLHRDLLVREYGSFCRICEPSSPPSLVPLLPLIISRFQAGQVVDPLTLSPRYLRRPEAETAAPA